MLINGTVASETLLGTRSADTISGGGGNDTIDGGAGNDTLSFDNPYYERGSLGIDLVSGDATFVYSNGTRFPTVEHLTLTSIENIVGSANGEGLSGGNDANRLDGRAGDDTIDGRQGNDTMLGGQGNDVIIGGSGSDLIDGGEGIDTLYYMDFSTVTGPGRVILDLSAGKSWGADGTDTISGIENVVATSSNDWIKGNDAHNVIDAGAGDDVVFGAGPTGDVLMGASGNDAIYGSVGNDTISGDEGIDWLEGGAGDDWMSDGGSLTGEWSAMHGGVGNDTLGAFGTGDLGIWGDEGNDTIEFWNAGRTYAHGGAGDDTFVVTDSMLQLDGGFVQIFDFHGGDLLDERFADAGNFERRVHDWGPNTGITYTDLTTGNLATVMLVGTALDEAYGMIPIEQQLLA